MKPLRSRNSLWFTALVLAVALAASWLGNFAHGRRLEASFRGQGFARAAGCAETITREMAGMEQVAHDLTAALNSGNLGPDQVPAALAKALEGSPSTVLRLGVLFRPGTAGPGRHLFGPYAERQGKGVHAYFYEDTADYSVKDWFRNEPWQAGWGEPNFSHRGGWLTLDFTEPFQFPAADRPSGLVRLQVSLKSVQEIVDHLDLGTTGFACLLSAKGTYMAHPMEDLVLSQKSILDRADTPGEKRLADMVTRRSGGFTESSSSFTGQPTWVFLQRIPSLGWSVGLVYDQGAEHQMHPEDRRALGIE